jgi:hypothetical protein
MLERVDERINTNELCYRKKREICDEEESKEFKNCSW